MSAVKYLQALMLLIALLAPTRLWAVEPGEMLSDPTLEARARALSKELRCMVCQNESIDDSGAPLAHDLRVLVRDRIKAGDSDAQVLDFLVARYGEFVLLKPRLSWHTALLWLAPFTVVLLGAWGLIALWRRRRTESAPETAPAPLTAAERVRVSELLENSERS